MLTVSTASFRSMRPAALLFLVLLTLACALPAHAQVQMAASPQQVTAGAEARASGSGAPSGTLQLRLLNSAGALLSQSPNFSAVNGRFTAALTVPEAAPAGAYTLQLFGAGTVLATTPLTVLLPLQIELPPTPIALGAQFAFTVDGLRPGQLQLRVNGVPIFGPVSVTGSRYEGFALLPVNVSAPGEPVELEARNLVGDQPIGRGSVRIVLADTSPTALPRLADLVLPPGGVLRLDEVWQVSGRLVLPRSSPQGLEARLFLGLPDGRMLPFSLLRAPLAADGSFSVKGDLASLHRNGVHMPPVGTTGDGFLVFIEPDRGQPGGGRGSRQFSFPLGPVVVQDPSGIGNPRVTVEVLDPAGNPLEDVIVVFSARGPFGGALGQPDLAPMVGSSLQPVALPNQPDLEREPENLTLVPGTGHAMFHGSSQVRRAIEALQQQEPGNGVGGGQGCPESLQRGTTDATGRIVADLNLAILRLLSNTFAVNSGVGAFGNSSDIKHAPREIYIDLLVNALTAQPQPHTFGEAPTVPKGGEYRMLYREVDRAFFAWSDTTQDYTVPLGQNPVLSFRARFAYTGGAVYPMLVSLGKMPKLSGVTHGPVITFPDPGDFTMNSELWPVSATTMPTTFGLIEWMRLERVENGQTVQTWDMGQGVLNCLNDDEATFIALVDGASLPHSGPGGLRFRIRVKQLGIPTAQAFTYDFRLRTEAPPPWFLNTDFDQRSVNWKPDAVIMRATSQRPEQTVSGTPQVSGIGTLNNRSRATDVFLQQSSPGGLSGLQRTSRSANRGANVEAGPASLSTPQLGIWVPWGPETILDTGTLPLFRMVWGVPPIASATLGVDARFWATLKIEARSDIDLQAGTLSASLRTTPRVNGDIRAFFNFSAVLGLVSMEASFTPKFSVAMPTTITNDVVATADPCMTFRVWVSYTVSVGLCDFCVSASGGQNAFTPLVTPSGCTVPNSMLKGGDDFTLPSVRKVAASFDSFGAGAVVEVASNGQMSQRVWNGSGFGSSIPIGAATGVDQLAQRHYAPGQAVLVYAASTLSQSAFLASTLAEASSSRRMVFRTRRFDGSWSNAQLIPVPSAPVGGEGKPALAACPAGQPPCSLNGEVYAVWLRGTQADPFSLATEVWGGRYVNGNWTGVQRLANAGTGSDQMPRVTYLNGQPVVSFVRQSERSIGGAAQRRLMLMRIGIDTQPIELQAPAGVIWQDIEVNAQGQIVLAYTVAADPEAVIGSQSLLYAARGSCSGSGSSGSCSFAHTRQRDGFGRDIFAESPQLLRSPQGVQVAYRGLGYGPDANGLRFLPGDSKGTIDGTGEFMSLVPHFTSISNGAPLAISGTGALHFNPQMIRHPVSGALVGLSNTVSLPSAGNRGLAARMPFAPAEGVATSRQLEDDLTEFLLVDGPDLRLLSASTEAAWAEPGELLRVRVLVENRGPRLAVPASFGVSWGGPWDSGVPQERYTLPAFGDSASLLADLEVAVPTVLQGRGPRVLHLLLDPVGNSGDSDRSNNLLLLEVGALPVPETLRFRTALDERHALIEWDIAEDPRVLGYQVYREFAKDDWQPIGITEVEGFVDLMAFPGEVYRYRVASYDAQGNESSLSAPVMVQPRMREDLLFADGFEMP